MSRLARVLAVCAGATAMTVASAYPAIAVETDEGVEVLSNKTISISGGTMKFTDDGDVFRICDTLADGEGAYGAVFFNSYFNTDGYDRVMTVNDGGDDGCDKKGYNIGNTGLYVFVICPGEYPTEPFHYHPCTDSGEFNE